MRRLLVLIALPLLLNGCAGALISGVTEAGISFSENRSFKQKYDDKRIYTEITQAFLEVDDGRLIRFVNINTRHSRVMLTGSVASEADAQKAVAIAWKVKGVSEVINELKVNPNANFLTVANDSMVKRNVESRLLITKDVWVINYSFDVQAGVLYIIGNVQDKAELTRVLNVLRTTKGVKRVVSHLKIGPIGKPIAGSETHEAAPAMDVDSAPLTPESATVAAPDPIDSTQLPAPVTIK